MSDFHSSAAISWLDITRPIDDALLTWPGRARPQLTREKRIAMGHHCNLSSWQLSAHSGTHMDAPLHFVEGGASIDQIPPDVFIGDCVVTHLDGDAALDDTAARRLQGVKRLLIRTSHSGTFHADEYPPHGALLTNSAAELLVSGGLVLLGTDRLSVDVSGGGDFAVHHRLLGAGAVIVEGLQLAEVGDGNYFLCVMPLRFAGAEASPVRAMIRPAT